MSNETSKHKADEQLGSAAPKKTKFSPTESDLYLKFIEAYPEYEGNEHEFIGCCWTLMTLDDHFQFQTGKAQERGTMYEGRLKNPIKDEEMDYFIAFYASDYVRFVRSGWEKQEQVPGYRLYFIERGNRNYDGWKKEVVSLQGILDMERTRDSGWDRFTQLASNWNELFDEAQDYLNPA